jgi:hypothetical protein
MLAKFSSPYFSAQVPCPGLFAWAGCRQAIGSGTLQKNDFIFISKKILAWPIE